MERRIAELEGHVIVAGLGRVGRQAAPGAGRGGHGVRGVDPGPAAARFAEERGYVPPGGRCHGGRRCSSAPGAPGRGAHRHHGQRRHQHVHRAVGARAQPVAAGSSRAPPTRQRPQAPPGGADRAISPYAIGGHRLAHLILSPAVVDFFETALRTGEIALNIEDIEVRPDSPVIGKALESLDVRRVTGATILAILRDGSAVASPPGDSPSPATRSWHSGPRSSSPGSSG